MYRRAGHAEFGGLAGLRDEGLLDAALARPQQLAAYGDPPPDLAALAASLAFGLARNHPFADGNKRTATVSCETFARLNGMRLVAGDADFYIRILAPAEGHSAEAEFAAWLRQHLVAGSTTLHEARAAYRARMDRFARRRARRPDRSRMAGSRIAKPVAAATASTWKRASIPSALPYQWHWRARADTRSIKASGCRGCK